MLENINLQQDETSDSLVPTAFVVNDDASANWVVRRIAEARAYAKRCADWCAQEQQRARREEEFFLFRFGEQLQHFARCRIEETRGRRKSVNLPAGVLGFRTEPEKLVIDNEEKIIAWAEKNAPKLLDTIQKLSKSRLNEHVEATGEVPDVGVHMEPAREKFYIK